jgi:hypothetical protein
VSQTLGDGQQKVVISFEELLDFGFVIPIPAILIQPQSAIILLN